MKYVDQFEEYLFNAFPDKVSRAYMQDEMNKVKLKLVRMQPSEENASIFNTILRSCQLCCVGERHQLQWTKSHGICVDRLKVRYAFPCYAVYGNDRGVELVYYGTTLSIRMVFGVHKFDETSVYGKQAFSVFKKICEQYHINMDDYKEVHDEIYCADIEKYDLNQYFKGTIEGDIKHIDLNSAFMSQIATVWPELYPPINYLYEHRKDNDNYYKKILVMSYGFMRSEYDHYAHAHMAKIAVENTNKTLRVLHNLIEENGGKVLLHNTDGLYFVSSYKINQLLPTVTSDKLGGFKVDEIISKMHIKSPKCYEFIREDGSYDVRFSGNVDKDRLLEEGWGSIDKHHPQKFEFTGDKITWYEEDC